MERLTRDKYTTKEIRGAIIALHRCGKSYKQIGEELNIHA